VQAGQLNVASFFSLAGDRVRASVNGGATPVRGTVTGYGGAVATDVALALRGAGGFMLDRFFARTAAVDIALGAFSVDRMLVADRGTVSNPMTHVVIDQHDRSIQPGANEQIYSFGAPFSFSMYDNHVFTDADVIYRDSQHDQIATMGLNRSVAEYSELALTVATDSSKQDNVAQPGKEIQASPVSYSGLPVSLGDQCGLVPECKQ
jgi:hypothetical protein